tara:strand:+ start:181 stop:402 length:222 start_codon:yes stop_codon:yes gene_type:complete
MTDIQNTQQIQIDPSAIIEDLLEQIKRLTAENATLRAAVSQLQQAQQVASMELEAAAEAANAEAPKKDSKSSK